MESSHGFWTKTVQFPSFWTPWFMDCHLLDGKVHIGPILTNEYQHELSFAEDELHAPASSRAIGQ